MEKFSAFQYSITFDEKGRGWFYEIYDDGVLIVQSEELFDSEGTARYAVIGHITILENRDINSQPEHF